MSCTKNSIEKNRIENSKQVGVISPFGRYYPSMAGSLLKNETKTKKALEGKQKVNSKLKKIISIQFMIVNEAELKQKLELLKKWYNDHWFSNREILVEQVKKMIKVILLI